MPECFSFSTGCCLKCFGDKTKEVVRVPKRCSLLPKMVRLNRNFQKNRGKEDQKKLKMCCVGNKKSSKL